jgi:ribose/xylose/arabinose/galactoside ABC-type transport system permease subunit
MDLTITSIIAFVTLLAGQVTKKFGWVNKKYIPVQNLIIGLISGVICWLLDLEPELVKAILTCVIASYGAGGLYDNLTIKTSEVELEYDHELDENNEMEDGE